MAIAIVIAAVAVPQASGAVEGKKPFRQRVAIATPDLSCPYLRLSLTDHRNHFMSHRVAMKASLPIWRKPRNCADARWLGKVWRKRAQVAHKELNQWRRQQARQQARRTKMRALYEKWRCIHEHEGAWNANTGNGYYGGLQMDMGFQRTYGSEFIARWGTADRWPVWAQLMAAERAYHGYRGYGGRGFGPWPNTRRMCGQ